MTNVEVSFDIVRGPIDAGDPVLLSNSLGSTRGMWDKQIDALARHFTVIRYDTRGHGDSPIPPGPYAIDDLVGDAVALLDRLGLPRVHFVGLSLGGMTGLRLAARHPARVTSLAVLCATTHFEDVGAWLDRATLVRREGSAAVAQAVVGRWYTRGFQASGNAAVRRAEAMIAATAREGYAACCDAIATMDLREDLAAISAPTLVIAGEEDVTTPPSQLAAIARAVSGTFVVVPNAAHLANDEQPGPVNAALLDHLRGGVGLHESREPT